MLLEIGVFHNASRIFVDGNTQLSGGIHELKPPTLQIREEKTLVLSFLILFRLTKRKKEAPSSSSQHSLLKTSCQSQFNGRGQFWFCVQRIS